MSAEEPTDAALTGPAHPAPPADREALTSQIERTREELGHTVEALVAKTDVKARARDKVAQVSGRLAAAKDQVAASAGPVREQVTSQAAKATATVRQATPEPLQRAAKRAAQEAGPRRVPVLVTAGAVLVVGLLLLRRRRR